MKNEVTNEEVLSWLVTQAYSDGTKIIDKCNGMLKMDAFSVMDMANWIRYYHNGRLPEEPMTPESTGRKFKEAL